LVAAGLFGHIGNDVFQFGLELIRLFHGVIVSRGTIIIDGGGYPHRFCGLFVFTPA
jgi:hypothetical protein